MMKPRRIRWTRHVARIERRGRNIEFLQENQKEIDYSKDLYVGERMLLRRILER
jgi:hypothetical protein